MSANNFAVIHFFLSTHGNMDTFEKCQSTMIQACNG